jgi:multiple sugar transport system permease protein
LRSKKSNKILLYFTSLLLIVFIFLPFALIIFSSFQNESMLLRPVFSTSKESFTLENYKYILFKTPIISSTGELRSRVTASAQEIPITLKNSIFVASITALINLIICTIAAFVFAYYKFRGSLITYFFVLLSRIIPPIAVTVPFFTIIKNAGLLDTRISLIFVYCAMTLPITLYFYRVHFEKIPVEIKEAAMLEGCSDMMILTKIILPITRPGLLAGALFAFFLSYGEFLFALSLTQTNKARTLPVLLSGIISNPDLSYALLCSAVVIAIIPSIVIGFIVRKHLTKLY